METFIRYTGTVKFSICSVHALIYWGGHNSEYVL